MRKNNLILYSSLFSLLLVGCNNNNTSSKFNWNNIYHKDDSLEVLPNNDSSSFKASQDYLNNTNNYWKTVYIDNEEIVNVSNSYKGSYFKQDEMFIKQDSLARIFTCPKDGIISVKGKIYSLAKAKDNAQFEIKHNDNNLNINININKDDKEGYYFSRQISVKKNDQIYFVISGNSSHVSLNPTIDYTNDKEILYQVPDWNFYGDVHPFYYDGTMYMYNLEGYLEDVNNERYTWRLHTSKDLFNYKEIDYEVFDFVKNHYNETLYVYDSLFSEVTFPYGSRDMFLFFDHLAQKYVYFGLCYHEDKSSCLGARVSDDDTGVNWSTDMFSIKEFKKYNDPECNQAMFINNRWYLFTSLWGESIHSVGKLTYYIGEENTPFLDNDWENAPRHELDGEDLCAGQLVDIGGKYLMYGWIPKTSYGNDQEIYFNGQQIHGLWGGNINEPREVYQISNGELRTRLDEKIVTLLNRGKIIEPIPVINGTFDSKEEITTRNFIKTTIKLNGDNSSGITLKANNKTYKVLLTKENNELFLSIGCNEDTGHPIASKIKINESEDDLYEIKIIVDHSIFEAFVNDEYSLAARTSLFADTCTFGTYSDNNLSTFTNFNIYKLAHQNDVYDN